MATVSKSVVSKSVGSVNNKSGNINRDAGEETKAALWASLGYVAGKQGERDSLSDGGLYAVDLTIAGTIDGQSIGQRISGRLTVGHETSKASSALPNVSQIVAALLGKMNAATRAAVVREVVADYAANEQSLPEVTVGELAEAENFLAALRHSKIVTARGPVKVEYDVEAVAVAGLAAVEPKPAASLAIFGLDDGE